MKLKPIKRPSNPTSTTPTAMKIPAMLPAPGRGGVVGPPVSAPDGDPGTFGKDAPPLVGALTDGGFGGRT